ncbi:hypothetical protein Hanom_Chr08g00705961 [Helianthus anomalus]
MWFTKILDLVASFSKVHGWSMWFALCNAISLPQKKSKYCNWSNLKTKCFTKCKPQSMYF